MRLISTFAMVGLVCLVFCGCYTAPVMPPQGFIYTSVKAPMDIDYNQTPPAGKTGTASTTTILGLVSFGDASAASAAATGSINTIDNADYEYMNVLYIYQKFTTVVHGK